MNNKILYKVFGMVVSLIILIPLIILLYTYFKYKDLNIYVGNEKVSPKFSLNIKEYSVSTDQDLVYVECSKGSLLGCEQLLELKDEKSTHKINILGMEYDINITKEDKKEESVDSNILIIEENKNESNTIDSTNNNIIVNDDNNKKETISESNSTNTNPNSNSNTNISSHASNDNTENNSTSEVDNNSNINNSSNVENNSQQQEKFIKIVSINGIPSNYVQSAKIYVEIEKSSNIQDVQYSFDNGKTWQNSNYISLNKNKTLNIIAKSDNIVSNKKTVTINKIDNTKPIVQITKAKVNDQTVKLTAIARDDVSNIVAYKWNTNNSSNSITVTKNGTYKVTVKDEANNESTESITINDIKDEVVVNSYKVTFEPNGSNGSSITLTCTPTSNNTCEVISPKITRTGFNIIGWSSNMNDTSSEYKENDRITVSKDKTFYAITSKKVTVTFNANGNEAQILNGQTNKDILVQECIIRNKATTCEITSPSIIMANSTVHGYSTAYNKYSDYWKQNTKKAFSSNDDNSKYFAQTSKTITITFNKNTTFNNNTSNTTYDFKKTNIAAQSLSFTTKNCTSRNNNGCTIKKAPIIVSPGNEIHGFTFKSDGATGYHMGNFAFKESTTLYARVYNEISKNTFKCSNCTSPKKVGSTYVEYENTVTSNLQNTYNKFIEKLNQKVPELFYTNGKVRIMSQETFKSYWGNYGGLTAGNREYPIIDIQNHSEKHVKGALTHELGHAFDSYYSIRCSNGTRMSDEEDIRDLINDCMKDKTACGFRWKGTGSDSDRKEFVANAILVYYYNIADTDGKWQIDNPEDVVMSNRLKKIVEKYLKLVREAEQEV